MDLKTIYSGLFEFIDIVRNQNNVSLKKQYNNLYGKPIRNIALREI